MLCRPLGVSCKTGICHSHSFLAALPPKCSRRTPSSCSRHLSMNVCLWAIRLGRSRSGTCPPLACRGHSISAPAQDFCADTAVRALRGGEGEAYPADKLLGPPWQDSKCTRWQTARLESGQAGSAQIPLLLAALHLQRISQRNGAPLPSPREKTGCDETVTPDAWWKWCERAFLGPIATSGKCGRERSGCEKTRGISKWKS
ncbi:hypothetical protein THAOC_09959 [Thalassiosira oceanica]|uniref:Uncharacterized protein n=1 Tax=Thalassiosira oceanica TaxID=159749 RepID=K0SRD5_THAOC|nr:hypothetical protein THAOC_09959 [Thalassiosira oceanica]|eukprot:EJK68828.1 hypothetical protein THAOC_09959 [Thalassiosira oceanica]